MRVGSGGKAPPILNLSAGWSWVEASLQNRFISVWIFPEPICTFQDENQKSWVVQPVARWLCRLSRCDWTTMSASVCEVWGLRRFGEEQRLQSEGPLAKGPKSSLCSKELGVLIFTVEQNSTESSKEMDGIWNRYNLESTIRIGRPVDFCFSTVPVSLNWFIHRFKALSVRGFSPGCKLRHLRCTATAHFSSAYRNTNWAFWWTVHILPRTD